MTRLSPPLDPERDHVIGAGPYELLIYGDYECPYTAAAVTAAATVQDRMAGVAIAYRHFPLRHKHPHAEAAARAAVAAARQGRWADMHRRLFAHQRRLTGDDLLAHAEALGLDRERFTADLAAPDVAARVQEDVDSGITLGVDGTPRIFVNGLLHSGFYDAETLLEELQLG